MIRIYDADWAHSQKDSRMFFDLNGDVYQMVSNVNHADITVGWHNSSMPHLVLNIWHNFENQMSLSNWLHWLDDSNVIIVTNVRDPSCADHPRVIFNDFLFNMTKAFYQGFCFGDHTDIWHFAGAHCYTKNNLDLPKQANRIYLAPMRLFGHFPVRQIKYRKRLHRILSRYRHDGWLSNRPLYSHHDFDQTSRINQLALSGADAICPPPGYIPVHNAYYRDTFISVFAETVEFGTSTVVTEKTYDPLIKGHFILPFSNQHFVSYLQNLGIKFPNFIDYSYDTIKDDDARFHAFSKELARLLIAPIRQWHAWWEQNLSILKHNQDWFDRPYDRFDLHEVLQGIA